MGFLPDCAAAFLAGGQGRRLGGVDKALLPIAGRSMGEIAIGRVGDLFEEVIVVTRRAGDALAGIGARVVADLRPGEGPLAGLEAALATVRAGRLFLAACDMPLLEPGLVRFLAGVDPEAMAVVPVVEAQLQPLHAFYRREVLGEVRRLLDGGFRRMDSLLDRVSWRAVDQSEFAHLDGAGWSFFNVNTPDDLAEAQARLAGRDSDRIRP